MRLLESSKLEGAEQSVLDNYARLIKALKILSARVENLDPELYHPNIWQGIGNSALNLQNYCSTFSQNSQQNKSHLDSANAMADDLLNSLRPLEGVVNEKYIPVVSEVLGLFKNKAVEELESLRKLSEVQKISIAELSKSIDIKKTELDKLASTIEQQKSRLDQAIAAYQKQFSEAETTRASTFSSDSKKRSEEFQKQTKEIDGKFKQYQHDIEHEADGFLAHFEKRKGEVEKIFNIIGATSFAGNFYNNAERERFNANLFRWISIGLMGVMVGIVGITFYYSFRDFDVQVFLFRFTTATLLLVPAIYAAQESIKHRESERQYRKMHLELSSIDAYLALLPIPQQHEIKAKLTEKFFGKEEIILKEENIKKHPLWELLSMLIKNSIKDK